MSPIGPNQNPLMPATSQQQDSTVPATSQQASILPKPSSAPPNQEQIKTSISTNQLILKELAQIANNPQLMSDPDKLQKALLSLTADAHRSAGRDAPPVASSLAHTLDIMNDPRGPKVAIRDRIATVLGKLSALDSYSRQKYGSSGLTPQQSPDLGEQ